jgi:hypothetical protein
VLKELNFKHYNIHVVDFNSILQKNIDGALIDDLHKFHLLNGKMRSATKRFFYHHIILHVCEHVLNIKSKERVILYFHGNQLPNLKLSEYFAEEHILKLINEIMRKIINILPLRVYQSTLSYEHFIHLLRRDEGRSKEIVNGLRELASISCIERYTFEKVKKFTKRNELTFLNADYFNRIKSKQLLIV